MKTDDLISQLAKDLKPVRSPENSFIFAIKWSFVSFILIAILIEFIKPRLDLFNGRQELDIVLQVLSFSGLLFVSLFLISWRSSPGRPRQDIYSWIPVLILCIGLLVNLIYVFGLSTEAMSIGMDVLGSSCAFVAMAVGAVTGTIFTLKARQGASTSPLKSGAIVGLAALGAGGLAITLHCGDSNGMHILLWHFLVPSIAMAIFGLVIGKKILRW